MAKSDLFYPYIRQSITPSSPMYPKFYQLSETAIAVEWGDKMDENIHQQVLTLFHLLQQQPFPGFVESVPAYTTLSIFYQLELIPSNTGSPFLFIKNQVAALLLQVQGELSPDTPLAPKGYISIPVCYDDAYAPDLDSVAVAKGISKESVMALHQETTYKVYMMGFLPGFAYMGTVSDAIASARKPTPRARVEAGSVGIAGKQTGIYPIDTPGGWQIIGRTPSRMFDPEAKHPFLLKTGDTVKFYTISKAAFEESSDPKNTPPPRPPASRPADAVLLKSGIYTTMQDYGRFGFRAFGVPAGGAMDLPAHQIGNALVGNRQHAATIECTMGDLILHINTDTCVALTGGGTAFINDKNAALYACHAVSKNDIVAIKFNKQGIRTYIAVKGGFDAPALMNSKSMSPVAGIGAPLKKGEELWFGMDCASSIKQVDSAFAQPVNVGHKTIRVMHGPEYNWMTEDSASAFYTQEYTLTNRCDRMGCHVQAAALLLSEPRDMLSAAVTNGAIQLTPNGQLILLMSDCQTTGGYPRVGQIAAVDLPRIAQLGSGETIRFEFISFAEAEALFLLQQTAIHALFS